MVNPQHLSKPPIKEALVDIRIPIDRTLDSSRLRSLQTRLLDAYPKSDEKMQFQAEFRVEAGKLLQPNAKDLGFQGLWLTSADGQRIAQFRQDGFTLNNVGNYMGGDALLEEALRLWTLFADVAKPTVVTRIALRYLNMLNLPLGAGEDFERFLTAAPQLPPEAPQLFSSFISRVVAHTAEQDGAPLVMVTQKLERSVLAAAYVVLDIDAVTPREVEPTASAISPLLNELRALKNRVFFSLLKPEAVKLFV